MLIVVNVKVIDTDADTVVWGYGIEESTPYADVTEYNALANQQKEGEPMSPELMEATGDLNRAVMVNAFDTVTKRMEDARESIIAQAGSQLANLAKGEEGGDE